MEHFKKATDINNYVTGYIKGADAKVPILMVLGTAITGVISPSLYKWLAVKPIGGGYYFFWAMFALAVASALGWPGFSPK